MKRVAIIGGGISGVATAYSLARGAQAGRACEFQLFESSHRLGGIVETVHRDGFVIECGPDSWVSEKPWARERAVELGLGSEIISSKDTIRRTYILHQDRLVPMPDGMRMMVPTDLDALRQSPLFSPEATSAYLAEPGRAAELRTNAPVDDESVASFVRRHFGDEATQTVAGPLLAGVFGGSIERLSVRAVMPAFVRMEREHGSLIHALQNQSGSRGPSSFTTLRSGLQTLIDRMVALLPHEAVHLQCPVLALARILDQWTVITSAGSEAFDAVVLATPIHVTRQLLAPVDSSLDKLLDLDATSAIVVALAFHPPLAAPFAIPPGFGFLVPPSATIAGDPALLACTFVDQKFPDRVPDGGVLLRGFFGGEADAALLNEPDTLVVSLAKRQLDRILGPLPEPRFSVVRRWPRSLPQYTVGHLERITALEQQTRLLPGLHLVGNAYNGVGLPDLVRDGTAVAQRLLSEAWPA